MVFRAIFSQIPAISYIYKGNYNKAKAIYAQYKNEKDSEGKTGKEVFLKDLEANKAKIPLKSSSDVAKITKFLQE